MESKISRFWIKPMLYLKRFLISIVAIIALLTGGFVVWAETPMPAGITALAALTSDSVVTVSDKGSYLIFYPSTCQIQQDDKKQRPDPNTQPRTGFIFYPGARVDYRAYAPALRQIAEQGYLVVLLPVRLNMAFFDIEAAAPVLDDFPEIKQWAIGGHSLGGTAASLFSVNHPQSIHGLIFWASYPADEKPRDLGIKMLSIYGSADGLLPSSQWEQYKPLASESAVFLTITGGNHAQFGDYGPQPGDHPAAIPAADQWQQAAQATAAFLASLESHP